MPSLRPASPSFPITTAHASDLAIDHAHVISDFIVLYCILQLKLWSFDFIVGELI